MNASREDIEKFDAYLQGAMNSEEKMLFESALATNDSFRQEFELHEQITAAIAAERETHFRKILAEQRVNTFIGNNTWSKKFTLASAAVMLIGMLALFVSYLKNPQFLNHVAKNNVEEAPTTVDAEIKRSDSVTKKIEEKIENSLDEKEPKIITPEQTVAENLDEIIVANDQAASAEEYFELSGNESTKDKVPAPAVAESNELEQRIVTDQLMNNQVTNVQKILEVKNAGRAGYSNTKVAETSVKKEKKAASTADKADANMDLYKNISTDSLTLIKSSKQDLISIDYYKSPLNYKGYIYDQTKKKLTVYGLTDTTSKVFSYQNIIYLKNNGTYYIIKPTTVFAKYVILNDKAIIQELE